MKRSWLRSRTNGSPAFIPVVHLLPLPGAPGGSPGLGAVWDRAASEIALYRAAGAHGIILENHGDAPFAADANPPETRAAMAVLTHRARGIFEGLIGVNLLRNDGRGALAAAVAGGADFIRVNVWTGVTATDQGLIEGCAREVLTARRSLDSRVAIAADLDVKFGVPLYQAETATWARGTLQRGGADLLIASGTATGSPTDPALLADLREALGEDASLLVGSGATADTAAELLRHADGLIVGSDLKKEGYVENEVCPERLERFAAAFREA